MYSQRNRHGRRQNDKTHARDRSGDSGVRGGLGLKPCPLININIVYGNEDQGPSIIYNIY